jgi:hypothetical protein
MPPKPPSLNQRECLLWQKLHNYISDNEGVIVSIRNERRIVFQAKPDSSLDQLLLSAGYNVSPGNPVERLMPVITEEYRGNKSFNCQSIGPVMLQEYMFEIPPITRDRRKGQGIVVV